MHCFCADVHVVYRELYGAPCAYTYITLLESSCGCCISFSLTSISPPRTQLHTVYVTSSQVTWHKTEPCCSFCAPCSRVVHTINTSVQRGKDCPSLWRGCTFYSCYLRVTKGLYPLIFPRHFVLLSVGFLVHLKIDLGNHFVVLKNGMTFCQCHNADPWNE